VFKRDFYQISVVIIICIFKPTAAQAVDSKEAEEVVQIKTRGQVIFRTPDSMHGQKVVSDPKDEHIDYEGYDENYKSHFKLRAWNRPQQEVPNVVPELELEEDGYDHFGHDDNEHIGQALDQPVVDPRPGLPVLSEHEVIASRARGYNLCHTNARVDQKEAQR
jgi:hypothetical protein